MRAAVTGPMPAGAIDMLRALSNGQRLAIVTALAGGERAVSDLEGDLGIRQPSLSQHLASLREAGIITGRRVAKAVFYRLRDPRAGELIEALHLIFGAKSGSEASKAPPRSRLTGSAIKPRSEGEAAVFARVGKDA